MHEVEPETIDEVVRRVTDLRQDERAREVNEIGWHSWDNALTQ